jgi:hypothetical protein
MVSPPSQAGLLREFKTFVLRYTLSKDVARAIPAAVAILPATVLLLAWGAPPKEVEHATGSTHSTRANSDDKTVSDGPRSVSRRFADLDAYLAWLEMRAKLGGSWYREVRPGVYELQGGNLRLPEGDRRQRTFTRRQLAERFGFPH